MEATETIQPRIPNIAGTVPEALQAMLALGKAAAKGGVPQTTHTLVHLRASQINGCSFCAEMHSRELREAGEPDERIWTVAAWREALYFTDAKRAALALAEAATRLSDRSDPVPDEIWEEAARHYDARHSPHSSYRSSHQRLEQAQRHNAPTSRLLELRDPSQAAPTLQTNRLAGAAAAAGWTLTTHTAPRTGRSTHILQTGRGRSQ
jgi:AhpD family alkylhydroperoxidase